VLEGVLKFLITKSVAHKLHIFPGRPLHDPAKKVDRISQCLRSWFEPADAGGNAGQGGFSQVRHHSEYGTKKCKCTAGILPLAAWLERGTLCAEMLTFILRRFLSSLVVLFVVVSFTFLLSVSQKGGPFEKEKMTAEAKAAKERAFELDGPKWWQLYRFEKHIVMEGYFGKSTRYLNRTVMEILGQKMPNSLILGAASFVIAAFGGVALGFFAAMKRDTIFDLSSMFVALGAISIPTFVTGPLLIAVFGLWLGWLPIGGFGGFNQIILPAICLALPFMAYVARLMRNSLLDVVSQNYMRTAKAKGLDETTALARHALKVAILPVITYLGPMAAYVLTGSFVVETVFNISGVGMVFVNAIQNNDPFLLSGATIIYSALIVFFNFAVDVTYTFLDKRIKLDG